MPEEEKNDDIHEKLLKYFSSDEIAKLTLAVIQINSWNRLMKSFGLVSGSYQVESKQAADK